MPSSFSSSLRARVTPRSTHGFTLLEVLVSVVVLSFGVLGVVGLQAGALQANKEARYQAAGARLGRELADLMRGNRYVWAQSSGSNPYLQTPPATMPAVNCFSAVCSPGDVAARFQMYEWMQRVKAELPDARIAVCYDKSPYGSDNRPQWGCSGDGDVVYIKIGWTRSSTNRADTTVLLASANPPSVVLPVIPN